ncbi:MAG TPA: sigma-70 family RNA polymerase sigma factor [Candidatus Dormibacteraeota bacterium]|nr:sigma-70 family RNA polymerase sigma factor [Candidatus Dormibacteraeota bacterium]
MKPWLYRIASNLALNHVTRAREATDIDAVASIVEAPDPQPEAQALAEEAARLVWDAAASLEPRQRTVLELAVRAELTSPEIAQVIEIEPAQASLLVHRVKKALGNAVRYLLVARRRTHCERLAEMVPAGVLQLTAEQRASVDRHMRRCERCQGMASRLTAPETLLGSLVMLPLPRSLEHPPHLRLTAATIGTGASSIAGAAVPPGITAAQISARHDPSRPRRRRRTALAALLLVLLLGSCGGIVLPRVFGGPPASAPVIGGGADRHPGAVGRGHNRHAEPVCEPTPAPTPSPTPAATPTPAHHPLLLHARHPRRPQGSR